MSQPAKLQEPTMEEILASIRRIIAEDDLRPPPPPPAPPTPAPAESAPLPATAEQAPQEEMADRFDDPEMSNVAANDVFEQRELPWRPGEEIAAAEADGRACGAGHRSRCGKARGIARSPEVRHAHGAGAAGAGEGIAGEGIAVP